MATKIKNILKGKNRKNYYLIDQTHGYYEKEFLHGYIVLAKLYVKYGRNFTDENVAEFWDEGEFGYRKFGATLKASITNKIGLRKIKQLIKKHINIKIDNWSSDFIHGLFAASRLYHSKYTDLPYAFFDHTEEIVDVLKRFPYHCSKYVNNKTYVLSNCYAMYMKHDKNSVEFIAGALATGRIVRYDMDNSKPNDKYYERDAFVLYDVRLMPHFKRWGIPIEYKGMQPKYKPNMNRGRKNHLFVSPFWPALFSRFMPTYIGKRFLNIYKAHDARIYAIILWRAYVDLHPIKNSIPYLPSSRTTTDSAIENFGGLRKLDAMWIEKNLTILHNSIINTVKLLANISKNELLRNAIDLTTTKTTTPIIEKIKIVKEVVNETDEQKTIRLRKMRRKKILEKRRKENQI